MTTKDFINKVICGDCIEIMKDIPNKSIDMILCDLPLDKRITI
jgi:site-specific DNA-methyltransferase (adenine-specific)